MRNNILLLIITLILVWHAGVEAGAGAASFLGVPVDARAAGMGSAFVAVTNDASAVYWNPAGLGSLRQVHAMSSMLASKLGDNGAFDAITSNHYYVAAAVPLGGSGVIGAAWKHFTIGAIEHRDANQNILGSFDDSEDALFLAYARQLVPERFNLGVSVKLIQQKFTVLENASANGYAFSLGLSYRLARFLNLGLRVDDNFTMKWDNGYKDEALFRGVAGAALSLLHEKLLIAVDLEQVRDRPLKANYGAEFSLAPRFLQLSSSTGVRHLAIRTGIDDLYLEHRGYDMEFQKQTNITYGFGLGLLLPGIQLDLDYCYGSYHIWTQNRFTFSVHF